MAQLQIAPFGRTSRTPRRPQHQFQIAVRPFQIVPFFIAPVLPGETMKSMLFQARVVSDPINNPLTGWWAEYYFWYVKHRDLDEPLRSQLVNMMIDPTTTVNVLNGSWLPGYSFNGAVDFVAQSMVRCVSTYFREPDEGYGTTIGDYAVAQISQQTFLDSALLDSAYTAGAPGLVVGADDTITGQEMSTSWLLWQQYRMANLTDMTYEEYLSTYGIPLPAGSEGSRRPELVRYVKEWSYPSNTVDPVTGTPTSAVSWAISERADKDRFFREPGFLFGMTCVRPKVYLKNQGGTLNGALKDALAWLPAVMGDNPEYSVRKFTALTGPLPSTTTDYRIDLKDLFLYGEQFTNLAASSTGKNFVTLPTASLGKRYPSSADMDALFKSGTVNTIRMDGIVSLNILGMQTDTSPTQSSAGF